MTSLGHCESNFLLWMLIWKKKYLHFHFCQCDKAMRLRGQSLTCPKSSLLICQSLPVLVSTYLTPGRGASPSAAVQNSEENIT